MKAMAWAKRVWMRWKMKWQKIEYGREVVVYFPVEDYYAEMRVSSVKQGKFTAEFANGMEPGEVDLWKNYGQMDDDVLVDASTFEVLKLK